MPLPKHKTSSSKRNTRRSHDFLTPPQLSNCPKCNEPRLPHHHLIVPVGTPSIAPISS